MFSHGTEKREQREPEKVQPLSLIEKYGAAFLLVLSSVLYFSLVWHYIRSSPYAHIPILDARTYWQLAINVAHRGSPLLSLTHSAPLYPLFLTVCVYLFGPNIYAVYAIQATLAVLTVLLMYQLWQQVFSPVHGFVAGLLALFYLPFVYYLTKLLPEILALFVLTVLLVIYTNRRLLNTLWGLILLGLFGGLAILARSQFVFVVLSLIVLLPFYRKATAAGNLNFWRLATVVAFVALPLLPIGGFNYLNTGGLYVTAPNGGITFYEGNNPRARGTYSSVPGISDDVNLQLKDMVKVASDHFGRPVTIWEADRYFWNKGMNYIKNNPLDWLKLELKKVMLLLNPKETFTIYDIYLERSQYLPFLFVFFLGWGIIFPLSLIGSFAIFFAEKRQKMASILPFIIAAIVLISMLLIFYVLDRYRLLLLPIVAGFAAHGGIALFSWWKNRNIALVIVGSAVLLVGISSTVIIQKPTAPGAWSNLGSILVRLEHFSEAEDALHNALQTDPSNPMAINNMIAALLFQDKVKEALPFIKRLFTYPQFSQQAEKYRQFIEKKGYFLSP